GKIAGLVGRGRHYVRIGIRRFGFLVSFSVEVEGPERAVAEIDQFGNIERTGGVEAIKIRVTGGLDRLRRRCRRTGRIAFSQQAVDVLEVLLLREQIATLPALAPV